MLFLHKHLRALTGPARAATLALLLAAGGIFFNSGCATNPATGEKELFLVSEGQEAELGKQADASAIAAFGEYEDAALTAYVRRVGERMAASSERPSLDWTFRVLDDPVVNAMAVPGGYIYVTRGILSTLNSEAQLAGVIGHEIGHVTARHGARQATREQLFTIGLGVGSVLSEDFARYGQIASSGLGLLFLKYGRDDENQADELGIRYATRVNYDPREVPATYATLQALAARSSGRLPTFLSTHPDPGDRQTRTRTLAEQAIANVNPANLRVLRNEYLHTIDGIVFGADPRQGFVEGSTFYHPELRFQFNYPSGWQVINTHSQVVAQQSAEGGSGVALTIVPSQGMNAPGDYAAMLVQRNVVADAQGRTETIAGWPAWVGTVAARQRDGGVVNLYAAWIARESGRLFQFLGGPVQGSGTFFASTVRSMRPLTDMEKLSRQPNRLRVIEVTSATTTLAALAQSTPRLAVSVDDLALLNNVDRNATLTRGTLVKVVTRGTDGEVSAR